jgi:hypothetical protein
LERPLEPAPSNAALQLRNNGTQPRIEVGPIETVEVSVRTTWITDPDGNRIQIGQPGRREQAAGQV